jgi:hypothetical protein
MTNTTWTASARTLGPADVLAESRVDLGEMIRIGIPPRKFVPGSGGAFVPGKRHHIAAPSKEGKSLSIGTIAAVDIVTAGSVVAVLDRENGADEYARRLEQVLDAREVSDEERELVYANYRYHAWPTLKLEWGNDPGPYVRAFAGIDVVIFDSVRKFLTSAGMKEDSSDDYSDFTDALIDPLWAANIATVMLDNEGYRRGRVRGTTAKPDYCDVMFSLKRAKRTEKYSLVKAGRLEMNCTHSRFGELTGTWALDLGGGTYGHWRQEGATEQRGATTDDAPTGLALLKLRVLELLRERGDMKLGEIAKALGVGGKDTGLGRALRALKDDDEIHKPGGRGVYSLGPKPE